MHALRAWLAAGWAAVLLPWYAIDAKSAAPLPAAAQALWGDRPWLLPLLLALLAADWAALGPPRPRVLLFAGLGGIAWLC